MKKTISVLLALALLLCAFPITMASAQDDGVFVIADGVTYKVHQGDTVTYIKYLKIDDPVTSIEGMLSVDTSGLSMIVPNGDEGEPDITKIFPVTLGATIVNDNNPAAIIFNFSNPVGKKFNKDTSKLIKARFTVTASAGSYRINTSLKALADINGTDYFNDYVQVKAPSKYTTEMEGLTPYDPSNPDPTQPATDEPTSAPTDEPTKPTEPPTTEPSGASGSDVFIKADGVTYKVHQGDIFDYVYYLNTGEMLCSLDGTFFYDTAGLALIIPENEDELEEEMIFPKFKDAVVVNGSNGSYLYNYSNSKGKKFNTDTSELIRARFRVTASSGEYEILNTLKFVAGADEHKYIYEYETVDPLQRSEGGIPALTPYDPADPDATSAPTEPPTTTPSGNSTEPPTDEPTRPTEPPTTEPSGASGLFVVADGVTYKVHQGETFEYIYYFNLGTVLCSLQGEFFYDSSGLEMIIPEPQNEDEEDYTVELIFPRLKDSIVINTFDGLVKYNYSSANGSKRFQSDTSMLIRVKFTVTASAGTYEIRNVMHTVAGPDEKKYLYNDTVVNPIPYTSGGVPAKTPYDPENPDATDPPTEPPTTMPSGQSTEPPTTPPTEKQTEPSTTIPSGQSTEPPTDPPTGELTYPPTAPPSVIPTDSMTDAPTESPTEEPTEKPLEGLFVKADGVLYRVIPGETFTYKYFLNINDKLCSLDGELFYDADGLKLNVPVNEDEEEDITMIFPLIGSSVVTNTDEAGRIKYNYSNSTGKAFKKDTSRLIEAKFEVTATSGVLEINNVLHALAGADEHKYIFRDEVIDPPAKSEGSVSDKEPFDPGAPEPERKYGDVDGDGEITIVDASHIQRHLAGIEHFDAIQLKYGDVDGDGEVTVVDATYIQRWLAGILQDNPLARFGYPRN